MRACNYNSWTVTANETDQGGAIETYPDTEYDVGGRDGGTTKTISQFSTITSTFAEQFPHVANDEWDAGYDLWTNNWSNETMVWNEWSGNASYWPSISTAGPTCGGVTYSFTNNSPELMFFRTSQVKSGSVDILCFFNWEVAHGLAKATDVPTQLEYGVEIAGTGGGNEAFPLTGLSISAS
jgi:hypothetical protein